MNTKITKILSVLATVAVVASSFVWALPVAAATPGDGQFTVQDIPSATGKVLLAGSSITDIAVASDGKTIYVAGPVALNLILKSTDAGQSFDTVQNNLLTAAPFFNVVTGPTAISIAPDDVNTIAMTDGALVVLSKDAGVTWALLPTPTTLGATGVITDIAVAPARSGTLLGREYVISIADNLAGTVLGDVQIIGQTAAWDTVGTIAAANTLNVVAGSFDFTSVLVTPNFLGDRCIVAVGTKPAGGSTALVIVNTATRTIIVGGATPVPGVPLFAGTTTDFTALAVATSISSSSIALPTNFDPTTASGRRAYVGIASQTAQADNDVYRVDDTAAKALGAVTAAAIYSVAYSGTVDTGILFMGPRAITDVKYTTGMTSTSPTWTTTLKGPTSAAAAPNVKVAIAGDYATTSRVFAGTAGLESAFSISNDAGVSFTGESLISNAGLGASPSLSFASDAKSVMLSERDGCNYLCIWQSEVPFTSTSWKRIFAKAVTAAGVALVLPALASPSLKTSGSAVYLFETTTPNGPIYVSQDGGVSFATRNGPTGVGYKGSVLRDAQTIYYCDAVAGSVYKSTNGAWTWGSAVPGGVGVINSINTGSANEIIIAGTTVALSSDDAATFTAMNSALPVLVGATYTVSKDAAYTTNKIIYAVDTAPATPSIYRVSTSSTSNIWENMGTPTGLGANRILGLTTRSGLLYATSNGAAVGILRTLYPADLVGNQNWQAICIGLPAAPGAGVTTTAGIYLYVRCGAAIYAYNDFLATTKPTLTTPEDNYNNAVNPSTGNGYSIDLKWKPMGTGPGQVDRADIEIVDKSNGFTGLPTVAACPIAPTNPVYSTVFTFQPNKIYQWRVRAARTTSTQIIDSPWSDARTINVQSGGQVSQQYAGPVQLGPVGAAAANLDPNNVGFAWAPVSGATEYQVIVATDAALTKTVAGTPAKVTISAFQATGLTYGTTYFWAVKATKPTESIQTVGTFTTMAKPAAAVSPAPGQPGGAVVPPQTIIVNPTPAETPAYIWAVIAIGAILVIAVIILIVRTRRVP